MTTNTDKLAAHMALRERAFSLAESQDSIADVRLAGAPTFVSTHSGNLARNTANTLRELAQALEAAGRVQQAEPVAVLRFQRDTPGHENDMPAVVSCNWLPDGDYRVYLAAPAERAPAPAVGEAHTDRAPLGFTDHEKSAWSIGVEHGMRIVAPTAQEASKPDYDALEREHMGDFEKKTGIYAEASKPVQADSVKGKLIDALRQAIIIIDGALYCGHELNPTGEGRLQDVRNVYAATCSGKPCSLATQPPAIPAAPAVQAGEREALIDLISQALQGTYHCTRVWAAWNVGTMSQDDFEPVEESDTPAELADAILAALESPPASGEKP